MAYTNISNEQFSRNSKHRRLTMELKEKVINEIKKIYDPEIPVNIYELGLIYDINVDGKNISVKMTLTTPNCPVAESLPKEVKDSIMELPEVKDVDLKLVWDPPWDKTCLLYTSPSPPDLSTSSMPSSA